MPKFLLIFLCATIFGCTPKTSNTYPHTISAEVENPLSESRKDVSIHIPLDEMQEPASFVVRSNEVQLSGEYSDYGIWIVLDSMKANEKRTVTIYYNDNSGTETQSKKRTQAELSHRVDGEWKDHKYIGGKFINVDHLNVPPEHKDHSDFIRYEGPGWESEKVAYRLYLDQRNAIDVFGKKTSDMILMGVGQDGSESYHKLQPWGMDIMKVGESLGLGSLGIWDGNKVIKAERTDSVACQVSDGDLYSSIDVQYHGWKVPGDTIDVNMSLGINARSRLTSASAFSTNERESFCTGIIKDSAARVFKKEPTGDSYGYMATFGKQSLNNDNLGLVVLFRAGIFHEDEFNHVVELRPKDHFVEYYFGAAWELELNGITNEKDFVNWVEKSARELANPVTVHVK